MELFFGDRKRSTEPGISPTVREGSVSRLWEPSLTVGLAPRIIATAFYPSTKAASGSPPFAGSSFYYCSCSSTKVLGYYQSSATRTMKAATLH
jgi:hypothetical protein